MQQIKHHFNRFIRSFHSNSHHLGSHLTLDLRLFTHHLFNILPRILILGFLSFSLFVFVCPIEKKKVIIITKN